MHSRLRHWTGIGFGYPAFGARVCRYLVLAVLALVLVLSSGWVGVAKEPVGELVVQVAQAKPSPTPEADALFAEGFRLYQEGSADSLRLALEKLQQAQVLYQQAGNQGDEAHCLLGIGRVYSDLGEQQQARDYYTQALLLLRAVGDRAGEATILTHIGAVYDDLGEKQQALDYFNQALLLSRAVGDRAGEAATLHNIGRVYYDLGEKQQALDYYTQALPLSRAVSDRAGEAYTLTNIGAIYSALGEQQQALDYYNQALPLWRAVGDRAGEAATLHNIGRVYDDLGEKQQALDYYTQALPLSRAVGNRAGEATTLRNVAVSYRNQGEPEQALTQVNAAIAIIEDMRASFTNTDFKASYFSTVQGYYQLKVDILMQLGQSEAAFNTSERSRARSLVDLLNQSHIDLSTSIDDPELKTLIQEAQSLEDQLEALNNQRILRLSNAAQGEADAIQQELDTIEADLKLKLTVKESQISDKHPELIALKDLDSSLTLEQAQQELGDDDLLLQYALDQDRSYLFAITKTDLTVHPLAGQETIAPLAESFFQVIMQGETRKSEIVPKGTCLNQYILPPAVVQQMQGKRLIIAADGILHTLPFAALPTPSLAATSPNSCESGQGNLLRNALGFGSNNAENDYTPLLVTQDLGIVNIPSITAIHILRETVNRQPAIAPKTLAVLANPVFTANDPRMTGTGTAKTCAAAPQATASIAQPSSTDESLPLEVRAAMRSVDLAQIEPLPCTGYEAAQILALVTDPNQKVTALDFAATQAWIDQSPLDQYQTVHFATHGMVDNERPQFSGFVLSRFDANHQPLEDFYLSLNEIFNLNLNAKLVVLSACETGMGDNVRGEGILGMARGFMYAGAERIVSSLWKVSDPATAELMTQFYTAMLNEGATPPQALQQAQRAMWQAGKLPYY